MNLTPTKLLCIVSANSKESKNLNNANFKILVATWVIFESICLITFKVQLWAPWPQPAPRAVPRVHNPTLCTQGSFWAQRQLYCQNLTQCLARKLIPANQCIWQTGKGSQLWEMGSQCIPFTHTTLLSPAEQLGASWNIRTSPLQTGLSIWGLRQLHSYLV